ncbi:MAG TPA: hypothetical protein VF175_19505 [Lacipirellula sp.]
MYGVVHILLLGGLTPMALAAAAFGVSWAASRRAGAAWNAGVVLGFAAGVTALAARNIGLGPALQKLASPSMAQEWLPIVALMALAPSALAAAGQRGWLRWVVAVPLCVATPIWLLWGGKYLPSQEVRQSGFATDAWSAPQAVAILGGVAVLLLVAWWSWTAVPHESAPRTRSLLVVVSLIGAAATVGLTGTFVYAQLCGALAAAVGGGVVVAWIVNAKAGPEAAAGPVIVLTGALLLLAACYSALPPWMAIGVAAAVVLSAGRIPGLQRLKPRVQLALRTFVCFLPLTLVLWQAVAAFLETQRQQQEAAESNPYLNL